MEPWRTGIANASEGSIRLRGYDVTALMKGATFTDTIFLLHRGELPSPAERAVLDAILIAGSDHGPGAPSCATARLAASGNRGSLSASIAAGILAIGDEHGGAGSTCMEIIAEGLALAREHGLSLPDAAVRLVQQTRAEGRRIPGFGHRVHAVDPRTEVIFGLAERGGIAKDGVAFVKALHAALLSAGKTLPINVDGALAGVLHDMGFLPAFGRLVFIVSRVAGLTAEVAEEHAREKPMRIRIPVTYDGVPARELP